VGGGGDFASEKRGQYHGEGEWTNYREIRKEIDLWQQTSDTCFLGGGGLFKVKVRASEKGGKSVYGALERVIFRTGRAQLTLGKDREGKGTGGGEFNHGNSLSGVRVEKGGESPHQKCGKAGGGEENHSEGHFARPSKKDPRKPALERERSTGRTGTRGFENRGWFIKISDEGVLLMKRAKKKEGVLKVGLKTGQLVKRERTARNVPIARKTNQKMPR